MALDLNILKNKEEGLKWLYENYGKKLLGYSTHVYKLPEDESWDLVYKTIYKTLEVYERYTFENQDKFASFIFRMFINYIKNHLRDTKTKTQGAVFIPLEESKRDFVAKTNNGQGNQSPQMKVLQEELNKFEDWQRVLLLMRSQDVAYSEIAKYVDKPESQLKVYYQRLKDKLTERINERLNNKIELINEPK